MIDRASPSTLAEPQSFANALARSQIKVSWQKVYAVIFAVVAVLGATAFAVTTGLAHGEGMTILAVAWIGFAAVIYGAFSRHNQRVILMVLLAEAVAIGFLVVFADVTSPLGAFVFWIIGTVLSSFVHLSRSKQFSRGDAAFLGVQVSAVVLFGSACYLPVGTVQSSLFIAAAAARLGLFPTHIVLIKHLEQSAFCGRITFLLTAFMPLAVWAAYAPSLWQSLELRNELSYALVVSGVFFALTCIGQTSFRRTIHLALCCSLSIALFAFAAADFAEHIDVAWLLAANAVIAAAALFLCEDILAARFGTSDHLVLQGVATSMPWLSGYALIAAFEFGNSPITWGFEGGEELILAVFKTSPVLGCLTVVGWGLLLYGMIRNYARLFWGPAAPIPGIDLTVAERCALFVLVVLVIFPVWHIS